MQTQLSFFLCAFFSISICSAQISFSDQTNLLSNPTHFSGVHMAVSDMNGDRLDDIIRYSQGTVLNIEYQTLPNSPFTGSIFSSVANSSQWSTCIADVDHNGFNDILVGGIYDDIKLLVANGAGTSYNTTNLANSSVFLQGSNFADINNDGWADIFACHDDANSVKFQNMTGGNFVLNQSLLTTEIPTGNDGNYASMWTDYDNDGDLDMYLSKCRSGVSSFTDPRRVNRLFQNDGNQNFIDAGPSAGLDIGNQTWATDFGDIDNDGDLDCFMINHDTPSILMENNGNGTFTDITATSGMVGTLGFYGIQTLFRDFDNDGFIDIIVTVINGDNHRLYRNNGNKTFTLLPNPFGSDQMQSLAVGDLNNDGYVDVYGGYASGFTSPSNRPDRLWMNNGGSNNHLCVDLEGNRSNINGIGARIEIYGSWGIQIREVRSGEGYGIHNSFKQYFGIGNATVIDQVVVKWPSGVVDVIDTPPMNQSLLVSEGSSPGCYVRSVINSNPIPGGLYEVGQEIYSQGNVVNSPVDFEAGNRVFLDDGFEAGTVATFTATINPCTP